MKHTKKEDCNKTDLAWSDRDEHDSDVLVLEKVLDEGALQQWDTAREGDEPPQTLVSETIRLDDADTSFAFMDGTAMICAYDRDDDAESCESGLTGSSDRDEWKVRHNDHKQ